MEVWKPDVLRFIRRNLGGTGGREWLAVSKKPSKPRYETRCFETGEGTEPRGRGRTTVE